MYTITLHSHDDLLHWDDHVVFMLQMYEPKSGILPPNGGEV